MPQNTSATRTLKVVLTKCCPNYLDQISIIVNYISESQSRLDIWNLLSLKPRDIHFEQAHYGTYSYLRRTGLQKNKTKATLFEQQNSTRDNNNVKRVYT